MKNKAFKVVMSRGDHIPIDSDEIGSVIQSIQQGKPCVVRSGIFNPSFYVSIVKDEKRHDDFLEDTRHHPGHREAGPPLLKNIFDGISTLLPSGVKAITDRATGP